MIVSVIIPCWNAAHWLRETLGSVAAQEGVEVEVIVVDDGSSDGSAELVAREFPWVRLIQADHGGPSRARNLGTQLARGAFIQYLDADDLLADGKLQAQLRALDETNADVAYGAWRELEAQPDGGDQPGRLVARHIDGDPQIALFTDFWCPPATYLFRRRIVDRVGAWDETLPVIQDARFVLDCALHGGRFVYCPELMAYYRVHTTGSVSTRDPAAFARDCFTNARGVAARWAAQGDLTPARRRALLRVYGQVARSSFVNQPGLFESAWRALEELQPGYVPDHPWHLGLVSRLVGYPRAEAIAAGYRQAKQMLRRSAWHAS